ncbi:MAG: hypothetical protein LKF47_06950 [Megasphaera sp.]|jgi:hypothetical protein|nr:hypothetical protein [Megasphaera sp.]MCI1247975.1 hypothetical protein [Megasphaera sp.]
MKKILSMITLCLAMMMAVSAACFAEDTGTSTGAAQEDIAAWMEPAVGDWYNTQGTLSMTVTDSTINGNAITGATDCTYDYPRTGTFKVAETNGERTMKLDLFGNKSHQYLVVDDKTPLRRSLHPEYNESMGGIYLGMAKADLTQLYKQPTGTTTENGLESWNYDTHKFTVFFKNDIAVAIRMYKDSDRKFDKSGLGATDTLAAYAQAYGWEETPTIPEGTNAVSAGYKIDQGEFFYFSPNYVQLSVYSHE